MTPTEDSNSVGAAADGWAPLALEALPSLPAQRLAVVGHVEMVNFVAVEGLPQAGEITRGDSFLELAAGGGAAAAAVQLARLSGTPVTLFTALGRDRAGRQAEQQLQELGLEPAAGDQPGLPLRPGLPERPGSLRQPAAPHLIAVRSPQLGNPVPTVR